MAIYREPQKIVRYLEDWIGEKFAASGASGAVLGISGGIDSSVLAALLAETIGADRVTGLIMPCGSLPVDEEYALLLAKAIHINTLKIDLTSAYEAMAETVKSSLPELSGLALANIKPRLRMTALYAVGQQKRCLVFGGSNKDEIEMGYFTKYGDSGVDLLPMADLLKGEVWALGKYLGVPKEIIERAPTAGLWEGQTDEQEMGITYNELDNFLATGCGSRALTEKVCSAQKRTAHKREFPPMAKLPKNIK